MTTIVGNRGQLWTSTSSPHLPSPRPIETFPREVLIVSWILSGLFLVVAVIRPRYRKRTNRENLCVNLGNPEKNREGPKNNEEGNRDGRVQIRRNPKGWFPKGWFWRMFPRNENRNGGTFGCSPGTQNRNEGTFGCSPGTKTGTRAHSPKPPFYETALLSPGDRSGSPPPPPV